MVSRLVWGGSAGARPLIGFKLLPGFPCVFSMESFPEPPHTGQGAQPHQNIRANFSQHNLPQAAANCFPFSREPKKKWNS